MENIRTHAKLVWRQELFSSFRPKAQIMFFDLYLYMCEYYQYELCTIAEIMGIYPLYTIYLVGSSCTMCCVRGTDWLTSMNKVNGALHELIASMCMVSQIVHVQILIFGSSIISSISDIHLEFYLVSNGHREHLFTERRVKESQKSWWQNMIGVKSSKLDWTVLPYNM